MNKYIKNMVKSRVSNYQKSLLRLLYYSIKNPTKINRNLNFFRYSKQNLCTSKINYIPTVFCATISEQCNLRCPTCLYLLANPDSFSSSFISVDKFNLILEKYNKQMKAETIFLSGGEPLLHPQFDELVDICKKYNLSTKTSTNGVLIKNKLSSLMKLDYVNVSLDCYDHESFKKYRGGSKKQFDLIKESLKTLKEYNIYFSISFLLSTENVSEIIKMIEFAENFMPKFIYFHNVNPHGCEQYKAVVCQDKVSLIWLDKVLDRSDYQVDIHISHIFDTKSSFFLEKKCIQPWHYFCFNSKGDISFCCHLACDPSIGNVFSDYNFNSPKMVDFRKNIMSSKIMKSCLYCQRRFMEDPIYAFFDSCKRKWYVPRLCGKEDEIRL